MIPEITLYDAAGTFGVILILISYFLLQYGKIKSNQLIYSLMNGVGSSLVLFSLIYDFNFPSFIVEFFWLLISIYGFIKYIYNKRNNNGSKNG